MFDLKKFREVNKLTQSLAANYFGCKQPFISQIETGDRPMPDDFISKIKSDGIYQISDEMLIDATNSKNNITMEEKITLLERRIKDLEELNHTKDLLIENYRHQLGLYNKQTGTG